MSKYISAALFLTLIGHSHLNGTPSLTKATIGVLLAVVFSLSLVVTMQTWFKEFCES